MADWDADEPLLRPLLTPNEHGVEPMLREVVGRHGYRVDAQVKLSRPIARRPPGITLKQWDYATRAELDFLVSDEETTLPEFAVELDDASHRRADAHRRDQIKDAVCDAAGLELLRVEATAFTPTVRGRLLVDYLIEARAYQHAFAAAQEAGYVPFDEPGDYRSIMDLAPGGGIDFVNDLAMPARVAADTAYVAGRIASPMIQSASIYFRDGWVKAIAWLYVGDERYLFQQARLRTYRLVCGIGPGALAEDLAVAAIGDDLGQLADDAPVLHRAADLTRHLDRVRACRDEFLPWSFALFADATNRFS